MKALVVALALAAASPPSPLVLRFDGLEIARTRSTFGTPEAAMVTRLGSVLERVEKRSISGYSQGWPMRDTFGLQAGKPTAAF